MNKVQLIGRLGRDSKGGVAGGHVYSNLSIATNEFFYDKEGVKIERTTWHRVVCWGKTAEFDNEFLFGGRLVYLEGHMQYRKYKDNVVDTRTVAEVVARYVRALEPKPSTWSTNKAASSRGDEHFQNQRINSKGAL